MHDLIPLGAARRGALTAAEIDATMGYAAAEKALATRQAYTPQTGATSPPGASPGAPQPCQRTSATQRIGLEVELLLTMGLRCVRHRADAVLPVGHDTPRPPGVSWARDLLMALQSMCPIRL